MTSETIDPGRPPEGGGAGRESFAPKSDPNSVTDARTVTVTLDGADDLARLSDATGTDDPYLRERLITQMLGCVALADGGANGDAIEAGDAVRAALAALEALAPANAAEGMLAVQMVGCHEAAMECLRRAARNEGQGNNPGAAAAEWNLRQAARLMALYDRQLAALDRRQETRAERERLDRVTGGRFRDPRPTASAARPVYRDAERPAAKRPAKRRVAGSGSAGKATKKVQNGSIPETGIPHPGIAASRPPANGATLKDGLLSGTRLPNPPDLPPDG